MTNEKRSEPKGLRYIGTDPANEWLSGVPARDLTAAEISELKLNRAALVASMLYEEAT